MKSKSKDVVLVVDDSPESLGMLNVALDSQGYMVLVSLNGLHALSIAEKITPDVVLLDAIMPEIDGFETCRRLKLILPHTPIIFMTGLAEIEDVVKGFDAGGVDYITKPISPDEVVARIKKHIETAKRTLSVQDALDFVGQKVLCVNGQGELSWATPDVYQLIERISEKNPPPWDSLSELIKNWLLSDPTIDLTISSFSEQINISYQRQQGDMHLLQIVQNNAQKNPEDLKNILPITKRESEVLYWLSFGKTSWEISKILEMSPRTVNKHLQQIYKKLDVDNRTAAAAISVRILEQGS